MAHYNVTLSIAHDPLTWRESRYFEHFDFAFSTFTEVQSFAKTLLANRNIPRSGGHYITITLVADDGTTKMLGIYKYARWQVLATGEYVNADKEFSK